MLTPWVTRVRSLRSSCAASPRSYASRGKVLFGRFAPWELEHLVAQPVMLAQGREASKMRVTTRSVVTSCWTSWANVYDLPEGIAVVMGAVIFGESESTTDWPEGMGGRGADRPVAWPVGTDPGLQQASIGCRWFVLRG